MSDLAAELDLVRRQRNAGHREIERLFDALVAANARIGQLEARVRSLRRALPGAKRKKAPRGCLRGMLQRI